MADRPWILPTSTPVQFQPEALKASITRLLARKPDSVYLTHFGRLGDVATLGSQLLGLLDETVALGRAHAQHPDRHRALCGALLALYRARVRQHGCTLPDSTVDEILALDVELNAQGMAIWLDRQAA